MGTEFSISFAFFAFFIAFVLFLLFFSLRNSKGKHFKLSSKNLFAFYVCLMILVGLFFLSFGMVSSLRSGFTLFLGTDFVTNEFREFGNYREPSCESLYPPMLPGQNESSVEVKSREDSIAQCREERENIARDRELRKQNFWKDPLLNGFTSSFVGLILLLLHTFMLKKIQKDDDFYSIYRLFLVFFVISWGIISVIALFGASYSTLRYYILPQEGYYYGPMPGEMLPFAIVFTPIWACSLWLFFRNVRAAEGEKEK